MSIYLCFMQNPCFYIYIYTRFRRLSIAVLTYFTYLLTRKKNMQVLFRLMGMFKRVFLLSLSCNSILFHQILLADFLEEITTNNHWIISTQLLDFRTTIGSFPHNYEICNPLPWRVKQIKLLSTLL